MLKMAAGKRPIICVLVSAKSAGIVEEMKGAKKFVNPSAGLVIIERRYKRFVMIAGSARTKPTAVVMLNASHVMSATTGE